MLLLDLKNQLYNFQKQLTGFSLHEPTEQELAAISVLTGSVSSVIIEGLDFNVVKLGDKSV